MGEKKQDMTQDSGYSIHRRYRGRLEQVGIYFGKLLRMFLYQNDWKVLPMSALVAGLVSIVIKNSFFVSMEGTLRGAFALACVGIWNGCFNSIQVICRERDIIKREHRSGMHISSYVAAHMLYQFLICLLQAALTIYVCRAMKVKFPSEGVITGNMLVDMGITVFLITYSSDMMALWISAVMRSTTTAMTLMPFILIFQLVFSGGIFSLPEWCSGISNFTISSYGLKCIASQADYNNLPMVTGWNTLVKLWGEKVTLKTTYGEALDFLAEGKSPLVDEFRAKKIGGIVTIGEAVDELRESPDMEEMRKKEFTAEMTVGEVVRMIGEDRVREMLLNKTAEASRIEDFDGGSDKILHYWQIFLLISFVFAALSVISLEFIDHDRR